MTLRLTITALLICSALSIEANTEKPNILFVMADDCTYWDLGCYGGQAITPHIDKLASQGMRFTQCFQSAPMCSPTRHALLTGLHPVKSGAYPNHTFVNEGTKSVAHYLKDLGYRVALSGKTHIAPRSSFPFEYSGRRNPDMKACDTLIKESAESKTPFCLFAMSGEPHDPWTYGDASQYDPAKLVLPPNWVDTPTTRSEMAKYLAEISYYDSQVGELLDMLETHDVADNTLVIVVSEQGSIFPWAKWSCYDAGLQSGMIARWPGKISAESTSDALVEYIDVVPTLLEAAGAKVPDSLDGSSMLNVLQGKATSHKDHVFGEMTTKGIKNGSPHYGIRSIRSKKYKLIWNFTPETPFQNVAMTKNFYLSWEEKSKTDPAAKAIIERWVNRSEWEFYDVSKDRFEQNNLINNPELAPQIASMKKQLTDWMASTGDQGQQTELDAKSRQGQAKKKKKKK